MMRTLPSGTVTLLFTDIEGSTKLLRELGDVYVDALASHRRTLRDAFDRHHGVEVDTQGDAFFVAFADASEATAAAIEAQQGLAEGPVHVRMGVHSGRPTVTEEGYVGLDVHKAARIAAAGHGGQIVASADTTALLGDAALVTDLGEHRLKDFDEPVALFQVGDGLFPPLRTISNTNLPRPASAFLGREGEVADVLLLYRDGARLVTLTGPGGSGKTRLAIEAASELVSESPAGVYWVPLAPIDDPELVLETIAQTLGAKEELGRHIGERDMLLLLDNLEQVVQASAPLSRLVRRCPNLRLLMTSRELLRLDGEFEYPVPPLARQDAVRLFCLRARVEPTHDIAELCSRLDDLPLAIELAAARARILSPAEILERLSRRLDLFRGGRDTEPRQLTLRATIEWSHGLLSDDERRLFAGLAVFVDGCTLEAAEAVCDADLDVLQALADKSLVRRTGERFWMLETIRDFAIERLAESGHARSLEQRHFEFFGALAESANLAADAEGPQRHDLVIPELGNLRAALDQIGESDPEGALGLAIALENAWVTQNPSEGARRIGSLLAAGRDLPAPLLARAFRAMGGTTEPTGQIDAAEAWYRKGLALCRELRDDVGVARLLHRMGSVAFKRGDLGSSRSFLEESLELTSRARSPRIEAQVLTTLGHVEFGEGNHELGLQLLQRGAAICAEIGFVWWQASALQGLAEYGVQLDWVEETERWSREALGLFHRIGDREGIVYCLAALAWVFGARGSPERAGLLWGAIEAEESRESFPSWQADRDGYARAIQEHAGSAFEGGREAGRRLPFERAVELALEAAGPGPDRGRRVRPRGPG